MTALAGTGALVRLTLRRERLRLPVWLAVIAGLVLSTAASLPELYPTAAERQARAEIMRNPATRALSGPGHGLEDYTHGAMLANEMLSFAAVMAALMSLFLVMRHLRGEEESGRAELLRAAPLGRQAPLAAVLLVAAGANLVLGLVLLGGLGVTLSPAPVGSALLFAASLVSVGVLFAGVAAVAAQLTEHARTGNGMVGAVLGLAYLLRAVGDAGGLSWLSWLSPIGWVQATRSYVDDRWWPLGLSLVATVALVAAAATMGARRDLGAGLLPERAGRAVGGPMLGHPVGLSLRLQRAGLLGWTAALAALGAVYGSVIGDVEEFAAQNEVIQEFLRTAGGGGFVESFVADIAALLALLVAGFAIQAVLRLRSEERAGRAEPLLATPLSRAAWASGPLVIAAIGSAVMLAVAGLALGVAAAASLDDASWILRAVAATLIHLPATWFAMGLALALFGAAPRWTPLAWVALGYGVLVGMFAPLLQLPGWALDLSPFAHVPRVPSAEVDIVPLAILLAGAGVLVVVGLAALRRRDVDPG